MAGNAHLDLLERINRLAELQEKLVAVVKLLEDEVVELRERVNRLEKRIGHEAPEPSSQDDQA